MRRRTADFLQGRFDPPNKMLNASADTKKCYGELAQKTKKRKERQPADVRSRYKGAEGIVNDNRGQKFKIVMMMSTHCAKCHNLTQA